MKSKMSDTMEQKLQENKNLYWNSENEPNHLQPSISEYENSLEQNLINCVYRDCDITLTSYESSSDSWTDIESDDDEEEQVPDDNNDSLLTKLLNFHITSQKKKRKQWTSSKSTKQEKILNTSSLKIKFEQNTNNSDAMSSDSSTENVQEHSIIEADKNLQKTFIVSKSEKNKGLKTDVDRSEIGEASGMSTKKRVKSYVTSSRARKRNLQYRKSVKFVSLAEAILQFQTRTPQRFRHRVNSKNSQDKIYNKNRVTVLSNRDENSEVEKESNKRILKSKKPEINSKKIEEKNRLKMSKDVNMRNLSEPPASRNFTNLTKLSFWERNERLLNKRKQLIEEAKKQDKDIRVFHAKPAPSYKSMLPRDTNSSRTLSPGMKKRREVRPSNNSGSNQENVPPKTPMNQQEISKTQFTTYLNHQLRVSQPLGLHSERRVKMRRLFDTNLQEKWEEAAMHRKQIEAEQREHERLENLELRKKTKIKANPMPTFPTPKFVRIRKPLTVAQSPVWAYKKKKALNIPDSKSHRCEK